MNKNLVVFTGGGSAGHVIPNIPLIEQLEKEGITCVYIGSHSGPEKSLIKIPFYGIRSGKLRRYFSWQNFWDIFNVIWGVLESIILLKKLKAKLLFSKGGFVSVPVVLAAKCWGIPIIIHESDRSFGLANRISAPFATMICHAFPYTSKTARYLEKSQLTGIPLRLKQRSKESAKEILNLPSKPLLLVMGGGQGSLAINQAISDILSPLLSEFQIIHCHGNQFKPIYQHPDYHPHEFLLEELPTALMAADLVICRSGATSVFEVISAQKAHLFIPLSKTVSRGDQIENATYFQDKGLSRVLEESELTPTRLKTEIDYLKDHQHQIEERLSAYQLPDATTIITKLILKTLDQSSNIR